MLTLEQWILLTNGDSTEKRVLNPKLYIVQSQVIGSSHTESQPEKQEAEICSLKTTALVLT